MTRKIFILFCLSVFTVSCKKKYTCNCYSDRRGFVSQKYSKEYKEKEKNTALSKCKNDYESSAEYESGDYCEIK